MTLARNWAWRFTTWLCHLLSITCWAAFTTTNLWLCNGVALGLRASATACAFAVAIRCVYPFECVACTLAPVAPRTFTFFWATRQVAVSVLRPAVLAWASTLGGFHCDSPITKLCASWATVLVTTIGALAPVLPVALAILLAWFCAASMVLLGATCLWASFATMTGCLGDGVHTALDSTTTGGRTRTVLAPTPFTINCACLDVARALIFISVTMRTVNATFHSIEKVVFTSLQATAARGGALSPSTPLSTDMGRDVVRWGGGVVRCGGGVVRCGGGCDVGVGLPLGVFSVKPQLDQTGTLLAADNGQARWHQNE